MLFIMLEQLDDPFKFCAVTYLDFLHARIIHDGTLNKKVSRKSI